MGCALRFLRCEWLRSLDFFWPPIPLIGDSLSLSCGHRSIYCSLLRLDRTSIYAAPLQAYLPSSMRRVQGLHLTARLWFPTRLTTLMPIGTLTTFVLLIRMSSFTHVLALADVSFAGPATP